MLEGGVAEAVVSGALLVVFQNLVGLVDRLEAVLGLLVARIAIRVKSESLLAIGLLEVVLAGVARNAQDAIVVLLGHRWLSANNRTGFASTRTAERRHHRRSPSAPITVRSSSTSSILNSKSS